MALIYCYEHEEYFTEFCDGCIGELMTFCMTCKEPGRSCVCEPEHARTCDDDDCIGFCLSDSDEEEPDEWTRQVSKGLVYDTKRREVARLLVEPAWLPKTSKEGRRQKIKK